MRWPRTPVELSQKTFLVIREDLQIIQGKGQLSEKTQPSPRVSAIKATETWPPKMRKKRPRQSSADMFEITIPLDGAEEHERPVTANLEAPLLLDPRFINQIDMSLITKESLDASMGAINLIKPKSSSQSKAETASDSECSSIKRLTINQTKSQLRARFPDASPTRRSQKLSSDYSELDSRLQTRRLDDNNNKNKCNLPRKNAAWQQKLSPVRPRSSRSTFSDGSAAASKSKKSSPEPCDSCGRSNDPERFHTHPGAREPHCPSTLASPRSPNGNASVIPVRSVKKIPQRLLANRLRSRSPSPSPKSNRQPRQDMSQPKKTTTSEEIGRKERKQCANPKPSEEKKRVASSPARRPRTVTCYICGREFGSASFPIHEPKCLEKWQRENNSLPVSKRRNPPQRPTVNPDHEDWNIAAWESSQAQLLPCPKCKRTFNPDRLSVHERNCKLQKVSAKNSSISSMSNINSFSRKIPISARRITSVSSPSTLSIPIVSPTSLQSRRKAEILGRFRSFSLARTARSRVVLPASVLVFVSSFVFIF